MLLYWLLGLSLIALFVEAYLLRRAVRSIPIRIHVNGTRGKSTVTRYIAAGLRAGGYSVAEKITGIVPTYFSPSRQSGILRRRGIPRVQEQVSIVRRAAADRAQALVIECMSLQPEYQRMESRIISPTVSVITNVKNDHREVMGNSLHERIGALSEGVQPGATVLTAERNAFQVLRDRITDKHGVLIAADILDRAVPATAHKANVEIAVTACSLIGIDRAVATDGILQFIAEERNELSRGIVMKKEFVFFNGFAVNDVESTQERLLSLREEFPDHDTVIIFNTRKDRPVRTADFVEWLGTKKDIDRVIVSGTHTDAAVRMLRKKNLSFAISPWDAQFFNSISTNLVPLLPQRSLIAGIGNIAGDGFRWIEVLKGLEQ